MNIAKVRSLDMQSIKISNSANNGNYFLLSSNLNLAIYMCYIFIPYNDWMKWCYYPSQEETEVQRGLKFSQENEKHVHSPLPKGKRKETSTRYYACTFCVTILLKIGVKK